MASLLCAQTLCLVFPQHSGSRSLAETLLETTIVMIYVDEPFALRRWIQRNLISLLDGRGPASNIVELLDYNRLYDRLQSTTIAL